MATIRTKLTVAYAGALLGSVAVFSVALYRARGARTRAARSRARSPCRPTWRCACCASPRRRTSPSRHDDRFVGTGAQRSLSRPQITPRIATILDGLPDYVVLMDSTGRTLYRVAIGARAGCTRDPTRRRLRSLDAAARSALAPGNSAYPISVANSRRPARFAPGDRPDDASWTRVVAGREVDLTAGWLREFLATHARSSRRSSSAHRLAARTSSPDARSSRSVG